MYPIIKRVLDIVISVIGLAVTMPVLLIIALAIKLESRGPVFFKQDRLGRNGRVFKVLKFRSMVVGAEKGGVYSKKGDPRVTRVGKFIRVTSIDELPQFVNILKGDMSIIGPRPTLTYHPWPFEEYTPNQKKRFLVRPGVTGWAQVNGRKDVPWNHRLEYDVEYVEKVSFAFDLKIFFMTIIKVLTMKDNVNVGETAIKNFLPSVSMLKLMYITNRPEIALIAEKSGVDWIFIDLEIIGKAGRQGHLDTVISHHCPEDVRKIKQVLTKAKLLVRVNPLHEGSLSEIDRVINDGAQIIMLPYFTSRPEAETFIRHINGRAKTCLLCETPQAVDNIDDILTLTGIDYIHIGLNDLHLGYGMKFMFELLAEGTVEMLCKKFSTKKITYGFGGISRLGQGALPAEHVIAEHYRLGSEMAILSRTFCNTGKIDDPDQVMQIFKTGIKEIRAFEKRLGNEPESYFINNQIMTAEKIRAIVSKFKPGTGHEITSDRRF